MPSTTDRLNLPYIEGTDLLSSIDETDEAKALALDTSVALYGQGAISARPESSPSVPGVPGRLWYATDDQTLSYDYGTGWILVSRMIGDLKLSSRNVEVGGWIRADGRALPATVYPQYRAVLLSDGSPYGVDAGNPRIPDLVGRVPLGAGGTRALGVKGGAESVALSIAQMPVHNHGGATGGAGAHNHSFTYTGGTGGNISYDSGPILHAYHSTLAGTTSTAAAHAHTVGSQGSGQAHENLPPFTVVQWLVYAGPAA